MNKEAVKAALVFMLVGLVLGGIIGYGVFGRGKATDYVSERDTSTYIDTIPYYQPVPKDSMVIKYVTRTLPVKRRDSSTNNKTDTFLAENSRTAVLRLHSAEHVQAQLCSRLHEDIAQNTEKNIPQISNIQGDNIPQISNIQGDNIPMFTENADSDSIEVEIPITQKRYDGDDYRAYVSGYEPNLDSIFVFPKTTVIHERSYKPPNKWHIGVQCGVGYTFKSKQFEPFIGVGLSYSIISF